MFKDQQATTPGLMFNRYLPDLLQEFIGSICDRRNSLSTKHGKIKCILDILEGGAACTFQQLHKDGSWLEESRKKNVEQLKRLLKQYQKP
eukprot:53336-Eustigmatos_ZCMA.PRE.1